MDILKLSIEFILTFIIIYLFYYFFTIKKCKKNKKYVPVEVNLIITIYKIDVKKIDLYKMIKIVCLITSFIISISVVLIMSLSKNNILSLIIGSILSLVLAIIIYSFIGKYYKKKNK